MQSDRRTPGAKTTECKKFGATSWRGHSLIHSTVENPESWRR